MTLTAENFDLLKTVNACQIAELKRVGSIFDSTNCLEFYRVVRNVESAVVHTYQLIARASIQEEDPKKASEHWKFMLNFCNSALKELKQIKSKYPSCGASDVYNLTLDYRAQVHKRYIQNIQDSECQTMPEGLFPQTN
ncbi:MAG TPA: hypothetical protein VGO67_19565 [Verrucomicrobiae bacterium]|jgi:hypothetical protein